MGKNKRSTRVRCAKTGRFVKKSEATKRPATTVTETVKKRSKRK